MSDNNENRPEKDELGKIAERELLSDQLRVLCGIFIGLALFIIAHAMYTTYSMLTDRSIPVVSCPRSYDLDAPVLMKTIDKKGLKNQDRWIRGFIRRFVTSQFPRTAEDAQTFFQYVIDHSKGMVNYKYRSIMKDIGEISKLIGAEHFFRFYPKDQNDIRIRSVQGTTNQFVVEIDGFLIKKMSLTQERFTPTLRYVVEIGEPNLDNPEGLYVIEGDIEQITDYVSGRKEKL